jgi:KUP system potassium uptake protein
MIVLDNPHMLYAINPMYGVRFFFTARREGVRRARRCGAGADRCRGAVCGHGAFRQTPDPACLVQLCIAGTVINYFGQGALLLAHPDAIDNPFFKTVPGVLYPMIALATAATVIASQAVISGAFSMTREAMSLGYSMRMPVVHTSREMSGQIFVPWVNSFLLVMVLVAVIGFRSPTASARPTALR